jgi:hypothetical protein
MATTSEARALPFFTDLLGQPLQAGSIYIGQAGLDPVAYPAVVTSDVAGTIVVEQPVRTTNGHAAVAGSLVHLFVPIPYSITILDSAGRLVYASLNETDPVVTAIGTSSVQSATSLADLRARSKSSTYQVWVDGFGMYVYNASDTTSPESIPSLIVGNDGARYHLSQQFVEAGWVQATSAAPSTSAGTWLSWNDGVDSASYLTNNSPPGGGGVVMRTVSPDGLTETGRLELGPTGVTTASGGITATGSLISKAGLIGVVPDGSRALSWDSVNGRYNLPSAPLFVNSDQVITDLRLPALIRANQQAHGIGSVTLGTATMPSPGTWVLDSSISSVFLWVRTA